MENSASTSAVTSILDCASGNMIEAEHAGQSVNQEVGNGANTSTRNIEAGGHQEFVMLAEELQSNEVSKREEAVEDNTMDEGSTNHNRVSNDEGQQQSEVTVNGEAKPELPHEGKSPGNGILSKQHSSHSKLQKTSISVPVRGRNSYSQIQKLKLHHDALSKGDSKTAAKGSLDTNSKQKKNAAGHSQVESAEVKSQSSNSSVHQTVDSGGARSNHTVPQPFALATGKRALTGIHPADGEEVGSVVGNTSARGTSYTVTKHTRVAVKSMPTPSTTSKPSQPVNLKLDDHILKPLQQQELNHNEEDGCSVTSATSVRPLKARPRSSVTVSGFGSRCDERAEKRKEFFSKLDEKLHAKEVEKNQLQAKTKEEKEAAIKQLRKSLTFKATPMPSFYHEAAPPKVELKKIPTTRPKSPKLGRRNSCVGAESEGNTGHSYRTRFSLDQSKFDKGAQKQTQDENADKAFGKESTAAKKTMRRSLTRLHSGKSMKSKESHASAECVLSNAPEIRTGVGSAEIGEATASVMLQDSSAALNYEERLNAQECQFAEEKNEVVSFNGLNEIEAANFEDNILRESDSLIDSVEDDSPGSVALVDDLQVSRDLMLKINAFKVPSESVMQNTQCISADASAVKIMSVSSSQQSSYHEVQ